jgi:hypothetical protein
MQDFQKRGSYGADLKKNYLKISNFLSRISRKSDPTEPPLDLPQY